MNWLRNLLKSKPKPKKLVIQSTPNKDWTISRQVGRDIHNSIFIEAICYHGIGHHRGVHGCDGCCGSWPKEVALQTTKED